MSLCVGGLFFCGTVTTITRNACFDPHQTGSIGKGDDRLQLIKFWPSCAPGKGVCGGANFLAPPYYSHESSVCVSLSALFIHIFVLFFTFLFFFGSYSFPSAVFLLFYGSQLPFW